MRCELLAEGVVLVLEREVHTHGEEVTSEPLVDVAVGDEGG